MWCLLWNVIFNYFNKRKINWNTLRYFRCQSYRCKMYRNWFHWNQFSMILYDVYTFKIQKNNFCANIMHYFSIYIKNFLFFSFLVFFKRCIIKKLIFSVNKADIKSKSIRNKYRNKWIKIYLNHKACNMIFLIKIQLLFNEFTKKNIYVMFIPLEKKAKIWIFNQICVKPAKMNKIY